MYNVSLPPSPPLSLSVVHRSVCWEVPQKAEYLRPGEFREEHIPGRTQHIPFQSTGEFCFYDSKMCLLSKVHRCPTETCLALFQPLQKTHTHTRHFKCLCTVIVMFEAISTPFMIWCWSGFNLYFIFLWYLLLFEAHGQTAEPSL